MLMTIPYRLRSRTKAAGNSKSMFAHSAEIDIDGEPLDPSRTLSPDINGESLDPFRSPSPDINEEPLDDSFRTSSPGIDGEPLDNAFQMLKEVTDAPVELRSSPLSEVSLSLPSFSSLSPNPLPLRTIDENTVADFNDHFTSSNSPNPFPLHTDDDDTDYNDHPTSSDSGSNLENMDDVAGPSLTELHTAEAICQLKTHQSFVEPMNSTFYGPKRNSWAAEKNYGHHTLQQQTRQPTPIPVLLQSTSFLNPSADNYGTFSFYSNSSQAFPWSAEAFENYFPRAGLQTQPIVQTYDAHDQYRSPRDGPQTHPIVQNYKAQNQYGLSQYGQPQYDRPQYGQAQLVERSQQTIFPHTLGPFLPQRNSITQDAAAAAQQHPVNTGNITQGNGSRKRKSTNGADETNTNPKRRRRTGHYVPYSANDNPSAAISDDELKRRAVHIFNTDPWLWSVSDVYFSLTNVRSYDLLQNDTLPLLHPHLGLILSKFVIDGPTILINLTQSFLLSLGITRADHLAATTSLLDKIRDRSPTYQQHLQRQHTLNPIQMASLQTLAPQSPESRHTVLNSMHQDIAAKPLRNGENRKYHFVFGCFLASQTGANGQYTLSFNTVAQCLGTEQRRESVFLQGSDQHRDSIFSQASDQHHRTSVSFFRKRSN